MSTTRSSQNCSNEPFQSSTGYVECINEDLPSDKKYTIAPSGNIGMIIGIGFGVMMVAGLVYFYATKEKKYR